MSPKKLVFSETSEEEKQQNLNQYPSETGSSSHNQEDQVTALVSPVKPGLSPPQSASESGDGSDSSSSSASGFIIMPAVKNASTPAPAPESTPVPAEKKPIFSKIFSDEDEVALLQGLSVFWANGKNNKWAEFHEFIKDELPHPFTKIQLSEKIRGLKKKFLNGRFDRSDPHQSVMFELSKQLWGDEAAGSLGQGAPSKVEEKGKATKRAGTEPHEEKRKKKKQAHEEETKEEKHVVVDVGKTDFEADFPLLWASFPSSIRGSVHMIGREMAQELEERWRQLTAEELHLKLKKMDLMMKDYERRRLGVDGV